MWDFKATISNTNLPRKLLLVARKNRFIKQNLPLKAIVAVLCRGRRMINGSFISSTRCNFTPNDRIKGRYSFDCPPTSCYHTTVLQHQHAWLDLQIMTVYVEQWSSTEDKGMNKNINARNVLHFVTISILPDHVRNAGTGTMLACATSSLN